MGLTTSPNGQSIQGQDAEHQALPLTALPSLPLFVEANAYAQNTPDKVAIVDATKGQEFTYGQLLADAAALKKAILEELGLTEVGNLEERRIAFLTPNGYDYVVTQWAVWAAGGVTVPLCTTHPVKELLYTIGDSDPSLILLHPTFAHFETPLKEAISKPIPFKPLTPHQQTTSPITLPTISPISFLDRRALMIYTSGTTSNPKGCVTTHKNITFQAQCLIEAWKYSPTDRLIHVLPLHHVHGIINGLAASLLSGVTVEMHPKFDPATIWTRWREGGSTMFMAVPTIYSRLIDYFETHLRGTEHEAAARSGAQSLRLMVSGSAALPTPIKSKFAAITGQVLLERFGMTEIGMAISCGLETEKRIDGSVGWPLPGVQVRLTDKETGKVIDAVDEDGMIEIKGDNVFMEYWRKPEATQKEFTEDGWFKTGDVARRDAQGAYFIQGRASVDLIKSGGYKISALEVERKMLGLDAIQEVAVVGLADEEWGQRVAAVVKQRSGTEPLELASLRAQLKQEMAPYKVPTVLKLVDAIERNAMGKVNKKTLVQKYWPELA
ncbi:hypothetical protein ASPBRDRAFT_53671 [Aspergillus brasiliensis CBS 101740]|uniref:AMP-dependent synthetase/ligase domain-containing protein n=1 Tax=Aspergillus brasiliensis (strain CBS 101740 / IMI 381727 / IBT 21946) TaxID=767769 RepID=A0A1L9UP08_ASPBC|nr:hypothetical protein ASPBRDRAFT_53671 [Aspergillus brasiliensis CBS 101740]